jgi:hypothetical protein
LETPNDVCRLQAEAAQRRRCEAGLVTLIADQDHLSIPPRHRPVAVLACGIEPPFEEVARDAVGPGNITVAGLLGVGPDIDQDGATG